jgi:hypothetical protein
MKGDFLRRSAHFGKLNPQKGKTLLYILDRLPVQDEDQVKERMTVEDCCKNSGREVD